MLKIQEKCDVVICISHLGWESNRDEDDLYMIPRSRYIDLVLGGHTHSYFEKLHYLNDMDGKPVPVDQNGKHAAFVGKILLDFE
jgi:5'-nucleotidase